MTWGPLTSTNSDLYFSELNNMTKLEAVQGEGHGAYLAAQHISKWHNLSEDQDWRTPARVVLYSCLLNWVEIKWTDTDTVFSVDIFWYISKLYVYCEWMNIECCHVPFLNGAITWFSYICRYGCLPTAMSTSTVCPALSSMEVPQHLGSVILNQPMGRGLFWPWDLQAIPSTDVQFPVPCMPSLLACCTLLICAGSCQ